MDSQRVGLMWRAGDGKGRVIEWDGYIGRANVTPEGIWMATVVRAADGQEEPVFHSPATGPYPLTMEQAKWLCETVIRADRKTRADESRVRAASRRDSAIRVVTRAVTAAKAAALFKKTHRIGERNNLHGPVPTPPGIDSKYKALLALGANPDPDEVRTLMNNKTSTMTLCASCSDWVGDAVCFDRGTEFYCRKCVRHALKALNAVKMASDVSGK